ncbi:MAG TPA: SRPBCC domain-containing protein [Gammaproteobacteria bacterium]|nr:SRPBCC domain-containing protein [Gammaproteobacteria bacterium]
MKRDNESNRCVVVECDLPHPVEKVWKALTVPELLAAWLMPNDIRAERGHRFRLDQARGRDADLGEISCEVLECETHRRLRLAWRSAALAGEPEGGRLDSIVTFEIAPCPGGTRLRVVHEGLAASRPTMTLARAA